MVNVDYVRLCQEIKDDGPLPETCHDHNNHTAAAISLTGSEWGMPRVNKKRKNIKYKVNQNTSFENTTILFNIECKSDIIKSFDHSIVNVNLRELN